MKVHTWRAFQNQITYVCMKLYFCKTWQKLKSILFLNVIKHCPNTATILLYVDNKVFFNRQLFVNSANPLKSKQTLRGIDSVAWVPNCLTECLLWSGLLWSTIWPTYISTGHIAWLTVSTGSVTLPTHPSPLPTSSHLPTPLYVALMMLQVVLKKVSQNQPVQPLAM